MILYNDCTLFIIVRNYFITVIMEYGAIRKVILLFLASLVSVEHTVKVQLL